MRMPPLGTTGRRGGDSLRVEQRKLQSIDSILAASLRANSGQDPAQAAPLLMRVVDGRETRAFVGPELDKLKAAKAASGFCAALARLADQYHLARKLQATTATALLSTICDINSHSDVPTDQRMTDAQLSAMPSQQLCVNDMVAVQ